MQQVEQRRDHDLNYVSLKMEISVFAFFNDLRYSMATLSKIFTLQFSKFNFGHALVFDAFRFRHTKLQEGIFRFQNLPLKLLDLAQ